MVTEQRTQITKLRDKAIVHECVCTCHGAAEESEEKEGARHGRAGDKTIERARSDRRDRVALARPSGRRE